MKKRILTCISCPMGCSLEVIFRGNEIQSVTGHTCKRGLEYARTECTDPRRTVTSTVKVQGALVKRASVKTQETIPKDLVFECAAEIKKVTLNAPVKIGDIVIKNVCKTGIDVVSTSNAYKNTM